MKRVTYTFFLGILCAISSMGQPFDVVLNTAQQGNITVQARNSITLASGYSYTPSGGTFLTQIVNPVVIGNVDYVTTINPSTYSINTSLAVGKIPGEVNISGMASYTVPFDLPKGTTGLQPNLSLNYASSFNDGLLGIGWNMGGLSSISRVNQNLYFETQSNPIKGDLTDKYALDGKRLIVTSGTYGDDLSVYGTEVEEFSKITAKSSSGTNQGPAYFEVRTKSGLIYEYGNTTDSKILRDGTCVLTWKINKISDRYGNYITFTYFESDDERPILQILYTGSATRSPFAEINFSYKQRSDISTFVYGGKEFSRNILLDNIEVKNNGQIYKKYVMEYMFDNYAQLQKITEYSGQNQPLNPLVFTYTKQTDQISYPTHYSSSVKERFYQGDFNGDGRTDFVTIPVKTTYTTSDKWKLFLGSATGQMISTQIEGNLNASFKDFQAVDIDGDGLTDLVMLTNLDIKDKLNQFAYSLTIYKNTGNGFIVTSSIPSLSSYTKFDFVDSNGDGIREILIRVPIISVDEGETDWNGNSKLTTYPAFCSLYDFSGNIIWRMDNLNLIGDPISKSYTQQGFGNDHIIDFNGDGCSDILVLFSGGYKLYEFKDVSNKLILTTNGTNLNSNQYLLFGDFNGDGITDIDKAEGPSYAIWSMLSLIKGLTKDEFKDHGSSSFSNFNLNTKNNRVSTGDFNADGKMDIIFWGRGQDTINSPNRINVAINKGNGYQYNLTEYTSTVTFDMAIDTENTLFFNFGDYNGDGRDEFFYSNPGNQKCFSFATGTPNNLLSFAIDGLGSKTQITYKPMSDATVYTRGTGATYPLLDFSSAMQLVRQVDSDDGIGGLFTTTYKYEGAKIHMRGKGFLGFAKTTQTNEDTGVFTETNYSFDSPYYYPKLLTSYTKQGTTPISTLVNTWDVSTFNESNRVFPYIKSSSQTDNLKNLGVTSSVEYPPSNLYGNPDSVKKVYNTGQTETTSFLYGDEKVADWLIGRPTSIIETSTSGSDTQTFNISRTYLATSNSPDIDQYNLGDLSYRLLNRGYNTFGNLEVEYNTTSGLTDTHTTYLYDSNDVNLIKVTDQIGNETSYTWYPTTGLLNTQTNPFGNVVTYNYNTSDQLSSIIPSTGISTTIISSLNVSGGPANARYYVNKTNGDGSQTKGWYDKLGRELRIETKNFSGSMVKVDKQYNSKGEVFRYSEPTTDVPSSWNLVGHDALGRVNQLDPVFGPTTDYSYPGATTTRSVNGRQYKTTQDAAGLVTSTEDPGGTITNAYWPNGLLKSSLAPGSITSSMAYDRNGNRLSINDPSAGNITNTWYGTGQPKTTANAEGQTTTYTYTPDSKVQLQKTTSTEGDTNYSYYSNGLVNSITSPGEVTRTYTYELGKVKTVTEAIGGVSNLVTFEYDSKGRLYRKYFNGTTDYEQYEYASINGYLYLIQFVSSGITTTVWQMTNIDNYKRITGANLGTTASTNSFNSSSNLLSQISATGVQCYSYTFDANTGNLNSRSNSLKSKTETFEYDTDNLDRLTSITGPVNSSAIYTANKNGNIQTKSDAGTYVYDNTPYAVSSITNGQNISTTDQDISYYSFEKVKKITEGTKTADFDYNADQQRIRMILKTNGTETKKRYYFGGSCEQEVVGTTTTQYLWIGGDAYTAIAVAQKVGTGSWTVYNIFRDHLGTMTHLKNGTNPADEYSFDAWGRRRNATSWSYTLDANDKALFSDRGFTGHEYLEDFKLYNMNGRLYDPIVGRFLSPDSFVQNPSSTQSMNRYSYCLNNPLRYTDPSGNKWNWNWLNPLYCFEQLMQGINDNTKGLRQKMATAGVPDFSVGGSVNMNGNVNFKGSLMGQEVFNTENIDRSAKSVEAVNKMIKQVRHDYGQAWHHPQRQGNASDLALPLGLTLDAVLEYVGVAAFRTLGVMSIFLTIPGDTDTHQHGVVNPSLEGTNCSTEVPWMPNDGFDNTEDYYRPGSTPPKWFWPLVGAVGLYEIYDTWPKRQERKTSPTQPGINQAP